ncbi:hypothetical protein LOK49_LG03G03545 [Camellia lanceoleosa]|uniref:Uncharacterized protein n=1 Tax=Camellia lanceoleosa TaxID=1840588 RepID=A0ACC0I932_9ERIC|nr:hypothetical protein LOK49_LG03G03545 [Camellia lanceoleosa]
MWVIYGDGNDWITAMVIKVTFKIFGTLVNWRFEDKTTLLELFANEYKSLDAPWSLSPINRMRISLTEVLEESEESSVISLIFDHSMSFLMMEKFMKTLISNQ